MLGYGAREERSAGGGRCVLTVSYLDWGMTLPSTYTFVHTPEQVAESLLLWACLSSGAVTAAAVAERCMKARASKRALKKDEEYMLSSRSECKPRKLKFYTRPMEPDN